MTITQMQYFVAVYENGSISKAAEMLHISQPSVSMAIKDIEKEFGLTLFHRENKQFRVSQEGIYVYSCIKNILTQIQDLETHMSNMGTHNKKIRLVIPHFTGMDLMDTFVNSFRVDHPDIHLSVVQCGATMALKKLEQGECSMAIIVEPEKISSRFHCKQIMTSEFVYCIAADHPHIEKDFVSFTDIQHEPLILNNEQSFLTTQIKQRFFKSGLVPNILLYGTDLSMIKEFVISGRAATFLTKEIAENTPGIVYLPLEQPIEVPFSLVWNKDVKPSRREQLLIDHILSQGTSVA